MRVPGLLVVLVVAASTVSPLVSGIPSPLSQDDAGSGGDAPDRFEEGLRISPGTVEGEILRAGYAPTVLDPEDWYRFRVDEGDLIRVRVHNLPGTGDPDGIQVQGDLVDPAGERTAFAVSYEDWPTTAQAVADRSGWWGLRVTSPDPSGDRYRVTVEVDPAAPVHGVHRGSGYQVVSFRLGEGADADGFLRTSIWDGEGDPWVGVAVLEGSEPIDLSMRSMGLREPVGARVRGQTFQGPRIVDTSGTSDPGALYVEEDLTFGEHEGPGVYHVVVYTGSQEAYTSFDLRLDGNASILDTPTGGPGTVATYRRTDFQGGLGVDGVTAGASFDQHLGVPVQHRLFGVYRCWRVSSCQVESPDGRVVYDQGPLDPGLHTFLTGGMSGTWTFRREASATSYGEAPLVLADVDLPVWP